MSSVASLYGTTTSAYTLYNMTVKKKDTAIATYGKQKDVQSEVDYFKSKIGSIKSVDDLFKNTRLTNFVLTAVGLDDQLNSLGLVKRALTQKASDPKAVMNVLTDTRFKSAAAVLKLGEDGIKTLTDPATISHLADLYVQGKYEEDLGAQNEAVPLARYFKAVASTLTSPYDILGDARLRKMVTDTLNLPPELAIQPVETQAAVIEQKLGMKNLKNAAFVDKFVTRYLVQSDQQQGGAASGPTSYLLSLFPGGSGGVNLSV